MAFEYGGEAVFGWNNAYKQDYGKAKQGLAVAERLGQFLKNGGAELFLAASRGDVVGTAKIAATLPPEERLLLLTGADLCLKLGVDTLEMGPNVRGKLYGEVLFQVALIAATEGLGAAAKSGKLAEFLERIPGLRKGENVGKVAAEGVEVLEGGGLGAEALELEAAEAVRQPKSTRRRRRPNRR